MGNINRKHSAAFKAEVALEMIKGQENVSAICSRFSIHPSQAHKWKQEALKHLDSLFRQSTGKEAERKDQLIAELYQQIGQLKVERDWLKKKMEPFQP